jgi:formyltetrahydrofolate synthetase
LAREAGAFDAVPATHFADGGAGAVALARAVSAACDHASPDTDFRHAYDAGKDGIKKKIEAIVTKVYGGDGATYSDKAEAQIAR